jgi:transposase
MTTRKRFTKEFKLEAVRLLESSSRPGAEIARELGIRRNQLYKWQTDLRGKGPHAFPGRGPHPESLDELTRVQRELQRVTEERDILKKAVAFFANQSR